VIRPSRLESTVDRVREVAEGTFGGIICCAGWIATLEDDDALVGLGCGIAVIVSRFPQL